MKTRAGAGTPISSLVEGIKRADASLRIVRLGRAHVGVVCSYVVILWLSHVAGYVRLLELLVFYTFACTVTVIAYLPWLRAREKRLYDERAELQRRLGEKEAGGVGSPPALTP